MGNDWDDWANSPTPELSSFDNAENFGKQYLLPYLNYTKTDRWGNFFRVYLSDGTYFYFFKGDCMDFRYDVNGLKKPNEYGRDIFGFLYCPNIAKTYIRGKVVPFPGKVFNRQQALSYCKTNPWGCTTLLSIDGWEFKDDYPYKI